MTEELKQKAIDFEKNWFDKDIAISDLLIEFATEVTKELQEELDYAKSKCLFSDCDRVVRLKSQNVDLEKENEELEAQIEKMKCCINDLVHLGEFDEHTNEEYLNYQVHEALKNAEQFIKEIKENDSIRKN